MISQNVLTTRHVQAPIQSDFRCPSCWNLHPKASISRHTHTQSKLSKRKAHHRWLAYDSDDKRELVCFSLQITDDFKRATILLKFYLLFNLIHDLNLLLDFLLHSIPNLKLDSVINWSSRNWKSVRERAWHCGERNRSNKMADVAAELDEGGFKRTLKDLFAGAAGGVAQVLLGKWDVAFILGGNGCFWVGWDDHVG